MSNYPKIKNNGLISLWTDRKATTSNSSLRGPKNPLWRIISNLNRPKKIDLLLFYKKCKTNIQIMRYSIMERSSQDMVFWNPWEIHLTISYPFIKMSWILKKRVLLQQRKWIQIKKMCLIWYQMVPIWYQNKIKKEVRSHQM